MADDATRIVDGLKISSQFLQFQISLLNLDFPYIKLYKMELTNHAKKCAEHRQNSNSTNMENEETKERQFEPLSTLNYPFFSIISTPNSFMYSTIDDDDVWTIWVKQSLIFH